MLENRSFDNFLGGLSLDPGYAAAAAVDGLTGNEQLLDSHGATVKLMRIAGNGTIDPHHDWVTSHNAFNGGRNDGFITANPPGPHQNEVLSYLAGERIPFLYALAREFTVCDRW